MSTVSDSSDETHSKRRLEPRVNDAPKRYKISGSNELDPIHRRMLRKQRNLFGEDAVEENIKSLYSVVQGEEEIVSKPPPSLAQPPVSRKIMDGDKNLAQDDDDGCCLFVLKNLRLDARDIPTETDKEKLSYCIMCNKVSNHGFVNCPTRKASERPPYCTVCNKETDHEASHCPNATEDVLNKLQFCIICQKNTDHDIFHCPDLECVSYQGVDVPNFCELCRVMGHLAVFCPFDSDYDFARPEEDEW